MDSSLRTRVGKLSSEVVIAVSLESPRSSSPNKNRAVLFPSRPPTSYGPFRDLVTGIEYLLTLRYMFISLCSHRIQKANRV